MEQIRVTQWIVESILVKGLDRASHLLVRLYFSTYCFLSVWVCFAGNESYLPRGV